MTSPETTTTPTATAFTVLEGKTNIMKAIGTITSTGKKFEKLLHKAAVSILVHVERHGDITVADAMIEAVPNMARKNALRDWFIDHGKLTYNKESKKFVYNNNKETFTEEAILTPFWTYKPEPPYRAFDLQKQVAALVKKATDRAATADERDTVDTELLASLVELSPAEATQ